MSAAAKGRPYDTRLGENIAVLCLFAHEQSHASPDTLAALLHISRERAAEILSCLSTDMLISGTHEENIGPMLALYNTDDDGTMTRLSTSHTALIPALRLTTRQAQAVCAAWDILGVDCSYPVRRHIEQACFPKGFKPTEVTTYHTESSTVGSALIACASSITQAHDSPDDSALLEQPLVTGRYQGDNDYRARTRRIAPRTLRWYEDVWLIDAYDLDARAPRTFQAQRFENAACSDTLIRAPHMYDTYHDAEYIRIACSPQAADQIATWPGAHQHQATHPLLHDGWVAFDVPYYRGDWLPRHVLALGAEITHHSETLAQEMRAIAREDLARAREQRDKNGE